MSVNMCVARRMRSYGTLDAPVRLEVVLDALVVTHRYRHARTARKAMEEVDFEAFT